MIAIIFVFTIVNPSSSRGLLAFPLHEAGSSNRNSLDGKTVAYRCNYDYSYIYNYSYNYNCFVLHFAKEYRGTGWKRSSQRYKKAQLRTNLKPTINKGDLPLPISVDSQ